MIKESFRWLGATFITLLLTSVLALLHADSGSAGIAYLVLVVWFATLAGRRISIYLAIVSSILFDFYFVEPRYTLNVSGFQSWLSMAAFVVSCIAVSRVAERARRQTSQAEQRREDVERLYELNQEMMLQGDSADLVHEIPRLVERNFALDAVLLYVRDEDRLYSSTPLTSTTLVDAMRAASATWDRETVSLEDYSRLNLVFGMNSIGALAWKPAKLSREIASSIAAQVAIVITRAHAIEASARLEAARSTDRLRSALIDSLTHELRTPLTAIRAAATTLVDGRGLDDASRKELATVVAEESSRLDSLIGEAMEIAEIESDGIRVKPEPQQVATFLDHAVEQSHSDLASHQVTISVEGSDHPVWFDPHLIGRVLRHLLENAAHHTPDHSRIQLRGRLSVSHLEFEVQDDGPGIDPRDLPLIFEKFYRGRSRGVSAKGSGMGLAIARALVSAQGGTIDVKSTLGKGTTFRISIPLAEKPSATQEEAQTETLDRP